MTNAPTFDLVVVGAGIAGLATAELFARSGRKVALVERNAFVCAESSGSHHEWFHFGSLYAIFPTNDFMRTLVGGIDDLLAYYRDMTGMNLHVADNGKLEVVDKPGKWVRDTPIEYVVTARNNPDFSLSKFEGVVNTAKKLFFLVAWEFAIKQFISRHQRFHKFDWRSGQASEWVPRRGWWNYSRDVIFPVNGLDANLDKNTHFVVPGFDRPMESAAIIKDLLSSFLHHGGTLRLNAPVKDVRPAAEAGEAQVELESGETIGAGDVIVTSGRTLQDFVEGSGAKLNVVLSPLLVVYPAVSTRNFVRLTPFPEKTVNHLCHMADGRAYSLIGGSYSAKLGDADDLARARAELMEMARAVFPRLKDAEVAEIYESYKVEMSTNVSERNYQYHVKTIGKNVHAAIPGKFSLGFSLALDLFRKVTGEKPPLSGPVPETDVSAYVTPVRHKRIVLDHLAKASGRP